MYGFQHLLSQNTDSTNGERLSQSLCDYPSSSEVVSSQRSLTDWPQRFMQESPNPANLRLLMTRKFKFSKPVWSSNSSAPTKAESDNLVSAQQLQSKRDSHRALEAIMGNVEHLREEFHLGFEKCAQISQSSMDSLCSNAVSNVSLRMEQFEDAFSKQSERFDEKLNNLSSHDNDLEIQRLLQDVKTTLENFHAEMFEQRLEKLALLILDKFTSFKSTNQISIEAINKSVNSLELKVEQILEILTKVKPVSLAAANDQSQSLLDENNLIRNETQNNLNLSTVTFLSEPGLIAKNTTLSEALPSRNKRLLIECGAWDEEEDEDSYEDPFSHHEP